MPLKKQSEPGPLEKQFKATEQAEQIARHKASRGSEPLTISTPSAPFFARNKRHPYGTCWQCGENRKSAGGLPGGADAYWCTACKEWLAVRDSQKDTAKIIYKADKKPKKGKD